MNREDWPVGEYGVRPAGRPDRCFYCQVPLGEQHKDECVIRRRTVVVKVAFTMVVVEPESFSPHDIEFIWNKGTRCSSNIIDLLRDAQERTNDDLCICDEAHVEFVREATVSDEEKWALRVAELQG